MAERTGCAIVGTTHVAKAATRAEGAAMGSYAWTTVPRICWIIGADPTTEDDDDDDETRRVIGVSQTNYRPPPSHWGFGLRDAGGVPVVGGWQPSYAPIDDVLCPPRDDAPAGAEIVDWLREQLARGPMDAQALRTRATAAGHAWRTVQHYRRAAGARSVRSAYQGGYVWSIE